LKTLAIIALSLTVAITAQSEIRNSSESPHPTGRTWIFLQPESLSPAELARRLEEASARLTPRARARRAKTLPYPYVRQCDLTPTAERLLAIEATGCKVVRAVRYVNAVVVVGDEPALATAKALPFVREVKPVMAFASSFVADQTISSPDLEGGLLVRPDRLNTTISEKKRTKSPLSKNSYVIADNADYGQSLNQSLLINVPAAHAEGYRGEGVLIGMQDTGFEYRNHRAFRNLQLIATYDFLNGDANVFDEDDQGSATHGTRTLSVIAGLDSGNYIGIAPLASFVLTKTENTESETPVEEDLWVEGLWFHDSLGVDVLSSSLSYRDWIDYSDLDGATAVTTRAADSAFAAGMVLVNSMGNTGMSEYPTNKLGVPADARGVIAVGGVTRDSSYWATSSQGPTFDGRIKPDVVAQASSVYAVSTLDNSSYATRSGTSYSAPTVAGVAALVVQANRELTSQQVMDILHQTSSQADSPDTLMGYGIVNALAAVVMAREMAVAWEPAPTTHKLFTLYPNPTNSRAMILRMGMSGGPLELRDMSGRLIDSRLTGGSLDLEGFPAGNYWVGSTLMGWQRLVLVR